MRTHSEIIQIGAVPGNKLVGFNVRYASDPNWGSKIAGHMWRIDTFLGKKDYNKADLGRIIYEGSVGVNVRTSPNPLSAKVFTYKQKDPGLNAAFGYPVVIVDETIGTDGYQWYKVLSDMNPPHGFKSISKLWLDPFRFSGTHYLLNIKTLHASD